MANNLSFDPEVFEQLVDKFGLRAAWRDILASHVSAAGNKFTYILKDPFYNGFQLLEEDLLTGLSIGEVGVLYEYCVAYVDAGSRKVNGQFFTPDDVAKLMVGYASKFPTGVWLDPCSGIGNLSWHLVSVQKDKESFLKNNMLLADKDPLALEIARTLFTLDFQEENANLFNDIRENFIDFDFLSVADDGQSALFDTSSLSGIPAHDFVIVNPPYLGLKTEDKRFETSKAKDLYAYFLENISKTSIGFVSITPQSFTNAEKFRSLRRLLLREFRTLRILAFDNIPGNIFYGVKFGSGNSNKANSIRAAIMVASKKTGSREITSLLRWKTAERELFFRQIPKFLAKPAFTEDFFPKVSSIFLPLYESAAQLRRLESLVSPRPTEYPLFVPSAPRYFISALKTPVSRASMKTLYFHNQKDLDHAYLLLNSSFMYWWWRVRDGGMTLGLETIYSLPLLEFTANKRLVGALEESEKTNMVYKMNPGALHENVKHDLGLVKQLNKHIIPDFADRLLATHENSELVQLKP